MTAATRARATSTCSSSSPWRACALFDLVGAVELVAGAESTTAPGEQLFRTASSVARFDTVSCDSPTAREARVLLERRMAAIMGGESGLLAPLRERLERPQLGGRRLAGRRPAHGVGWPLELRGLQLGLVRAHACADAGPRQLRAERVYQSRRLQQGVRPRLGDAHAHHHHVRRAWRHGVWQPLGLRGLQLGLVRAHASADVGALNCVGRDEPTATRIT